jgi:hypothetical protein
MHLARRKVLRLAAAAIAIRRSSGACGSRISANIKSKGERLSFAARREEHRIL